MKKTLLLPLFFIIFSTTAFAYVYYETGTILVKWGLSGVETRAGSNEMGGMFEIMLEGENLESINTEDSLYHYTQNRASITPHKSFIGSGVGKYGFWKTSGTYDNKAFFMMGIVSEGELLSSKIIPHSIILFVVIAITIMAIIIYRLKFKRKL